MQSRIPLESILSRDRAVVLTGLGAIALLSWGYLVRDAWNMQGMDTCCLTMPRMQSWTWMDLSMLFVMWTVMMVAMMVPTVAPMILLFASVHRKRREQQQPFAPAGIFLLGYLIVWTVFSAVATLVQWGLHSAALLSPMMVSTSPLLGGMLLIVAGVFQWTPLKNACLNHCRSPLTFLMGEWRDGPGGALVMGLRHGCFCLGCCWFLMGLLFVAGVMNLLWVAAITAFVLLEKAVPRGDGLGRVAGLGLIVWGAWLIAAGSR